MLAKTFPSFEPYVSSQIRQWMKTPVAFYRRILAETLINNVCLNYASFPAALTVGVYMFTITVMTVSTFVTGVYLRATGAVKRWDLHAIRLNEKMTNDITREYKQE